MLQIKRMLITSIMGFCCIHGYAWAKTEPSKQMRQFLAFDRKTQDGFISTSVTMLAVIAAQTEPTVAKCVDDWYSVSEKTAKARNTEILKVMRKLQQYTPTTIVLATVERQCGKFKRAKK